MHARLFRSIKNLLTNTPKTILLALFLVVAFSVTTTAHAQEPQKLAQLQYQYNDYLTLFKNSSFTYVRPLLSKTEKQVAGFQFTFRWTLDSDYENFWKHIATPNDFQDQFIIRSCQAATGGGCVYAKVPYADSPSAGALSTIKRVFTWATSSMLGLNGAAIGTMSELEYGAKLQADLNNVVIIFKKGTEGEYLTQRGVNILATNWFSLTPTGGLVPYSNADFVGTTSRVTSLWYCSAQAGTIDPNNAYIEAQALGGSPNITKIPGLCNGNTFFKIGETQVTPPQSLVEAQQQNTVTTGQATATETKEYDPNAQDNLPTCDINVIGDSKIIGCFARLVYYGIYWPLAWIAGLFGSLFDFFLGYSISDESYRYAFAVTGWKLVRDIANIMFIIILVYTGFGAVFSFGGKGGATMRRVVPQLIINVLIINFSLFATRTVIDISNITTRVFYSRMIVCNGECIDDNRDGTPENIKRGIGGHWPLSEKIVSSFDPQKMFSTKILESKEASTGGQPDPLINSSDAGRTAEQSKGFRKDSGEYAGYYALVSLMAGLIMLAMAIMFFKVMFMFLGRVIGLYIAMIFSPFAFLTLNGGGGFFNIPQYSWSNWSSDLFKYAALAPIFTFFLYIIYSFLTTDMVAQIGIQDVGGGFFGTLLAIAIPMLIIYKLIEKAGKIAEQYAGDLGNGVQKFIGGIAGNVAGVAGGAALGLASGGAALLGTRAAGMMKISGATRTDLMAQKAAGGFSGLVARTRLGGSDWLQKQTFDARNTGAIGALSNKFGINTNNGLVKTLGFSQERVKGGFEGMTKRAEKETKEKIENIKSDLSDDQAKEYWKNHTDKRAQRQAEAAYFDDLRKQGKTAKEIKDLKKNGAYKNDAAFTGHLTTAQNELKDKYGTVTNNKQLTQALRTDYANRMLTGKLANAESTAVRGAATAGTYAAMGAAGATAVGGILGGALIAGANTEKRGQNKAAEDFLKAQAKARKKPPRAELLAEKNKELADEIETLEAEYSKIPDYATAKAAGDTTGMQVALETERSVLQDEHDTIDLEIKKLTRDITAATKANKTADADVIKAKRLKVYADKARKKLEIEKLDYKKIKEKRTSIEKNEAELEKIKSNEDKAKEPKPEAK